MFLCAFEESGNGKEWFIKEGGDCVCGVVC